MTRFNHIATGIPLLLALSGCGTNPSTSASGPPQALDTIDAALEVQGTTGTLPISEIEAIVGADGSVWDGVLDVGIARTDIGAVSGPQGVGFTPSFMINGDLFFQPLGGGRALLNGDLALLESEVNPFVAALLQHGLIWQAFHHHFPTSPQIWFVHFRGVDDPFALARAVRAAMDVTATPLPQSSPANPTTPLDAKRLADILHGHAEVGGEGVVTVTVPRADPITLGGIRVQPEAGISTTITFKPLSDGQAAVVPDFSMGSDEIDPVVRHMLLGKGWFQGCLYNQETAEEPQLFFDHMLKVGDAYGLAADVRLGLDRTRSR